MVAAFNVNIDIAGADNAPGTEVNTDPLGAPNIRFKYADDQNIDVNDPIPIPTAGTNRSRWKSTYLVCTTAPDTQVDNVKVYTDTGDFGTGITVQVGDQFPLKSDVVNTGYDVSDTADEAVTGHTDITTQSDLFSFSVGSPMNGPSISEAGSIINAINETTNYFVMGMDVISTASPGDKTDETITIQYDEI